MSATGLVPGIVIGLREGIEAALVVGLIVAYLVKTNRKNLTRYVLTGLGIAVAASVAVAGVLVALSVSFEGFTEELFEGVSAILAVAVLTFMIFWMMRVAKDVREHFEKRVDAMAGRGEMFGLTGLAFVAVFREGLETALFMLGVAGATTATDAVAGVAVGMLLAVMVGLALPRISRRISLKRFFQVTSILLILIAAGMLARGVHELQEAFGIQVGSAQVYNLRGVFSSGEENPIGYLLRGIVGYSDSPSQLEAVVYFGYLATTLLFWWFVALREPKPGSVKTMAPPAEENSGAAEVGHPAQIPAQGTATVDAQDNSA